MTRENVVKGDAGDVSKLNKNKLELLNRRRQGKFNFKLHIASCMSTVYGGLSFNLKDEILFSVILL